MFQNLIKCLHLRCAGSALKSSETQVRENNFSSLLNIFVELFGR